ncbi:glycoside hydrolase family 71 protein [Coniophora puteana RWD-64-598 SS2]|uniref:Glycoside hydrolase family 71 protein n=1 Tax=Coniophora puteana (strain RWD-64-598) TaxID=741705 RepID=A0A5M3MHQ4_CONPW|nr:glycoside hydrolase family 71 protein [Coniophora puteana RWD-64-598 SS2]EIW78759.1 glycoside hydrolase family 71 protein [Coniophora puteana RWD-64-598 SS2]
MKLSFSRLVQAAALASSALGAILPTRGTEELVDRASGDKYVFAHFMVGIVASYTQDDWTADMQLAQSIGIDGFALNIGKDSYNDQQLGYAYAAASATGFKVFISFDFSYWTTGDTSTIAQYINTYGAMDGQFIYNNEVFVSTFVGDGFNWGDVASQSKPLFACPNWQPGSFGGDNGVSCGFSWGAWPNQNNQPIDQNMTTTLDQEYITNLGSNPYMMPVSPWFFTHYGPSSYNKNWIFYSDWLWNTRWDQVLQLAPQFVEIVTWNDFGESHYIGPLHPDNPSVYAGGDTGAVQWVTGMTHDAWRDVAAPYIKAYKAGASSPTTEELVYYYRPSPKDAACSDSVAQPTGYEFDDDLVFVTALTTSPATVVITSGSNAAVSIDVPAGINTVSAPMGLGQQVFALQRNGSPVMQGTSSQQISSTCTVNNFNAYVGKVTA